MAFVGYLISVLWLRVLFGGKFWQSYWEAKLKKLEEGLEPIPNTILFNNNEKRNHEVVYGFINNKDNENGRFKKRINEQILDKPSVSDTMIYLSAGFIALWFILFTCALPVFSCL